MALVDKYGRITALRIAGGRASADLAASLTDVQVKLSASQVSEVTFTVLDTNTHTLARSGWVRGASVSYNGQRFIIGSVVQSSRGGSPSVAITAGSRYVRALQAGHGAKNWGNKVDRRAWARARARGVGMTLYAPGSLGKGKMRREKGGNDWELLVKVAQDQRALIFDYGSRLVIGSPAWLVAKAYRGNDWSVWYNSATSMHAAIVDAPTITWDPSQAGTYNVSLSLLAPDAHLIKPGDTLNLTGTGVMRSGAWLVTGVEFRADTAAPVSVTAVRPYKLDRQKLEFTDPAKPGAKKKTASASTASSTGGKVATSGGTNTGRRASLVAWGNKYVGRSIDFDGGYGAQCVDGFKLFSSKFVGIVIKGNGKDNVRNAIASGAYTAVSAANVQPGDIVSWGSSWGGGYGHIGVVVDPPSGGRVHVWNQLSGVVRFSKLSTGGVVGYARPKRWNG